MTHAPMPFRRSFAAFATLAVLFAPTSQLAHAQAMVHEAAAHCSLPPMHHHASPASQPHGSHHQHGATCCDLCPSGCQAVALLPGIAGGVAVIGSFVLAAVAAPYHVVVYRLPHALPFSLAPPTISV
jgi:hypothetical protein